MTYKVSTVKQYIKPYSIASTVHRFLMKTKFILDKETVSCYKAKTNEQSVY